MPLASSPCPSRTSMVRCKEYWTRRRTGKKTKSSRSSTSTTSGPPRRPKKRRRRVRRRMSAGPKNVSSTMRCPSYSCCTSWRPSRTRPFARLASPSPLSPLDTLASMDSSLTPTNFRWMRPWICCSARRNASSRRLEASPGPTTSVAAPCSPSRRSRRAARMTMWETTTTTMRRPRARTRKASHRPPRLRLPSRRTTVNSHSFLAGS
mmetsp:Transcript_1623/g.3728  ORF Transcript_1623/g.3728 Transcript_1623/m.3728 type:complete len:207 (-) Transcript_1623:2496-3116(-)